MEASSGSGPGVSWHSGQSIWDTRHQNAGHRSPNVQLCQVSRELPWHVEISPWEVPLMHRLVSSERADYGFQSRPADVAGGQAPER